MIKAELIKSLEGIDDNTPVYINGYEGGLKDVNKVEALRITRNYNTSEYEGPHEMFDRVLKEAELLDDETEELYGNPLDHGEPPTEGIYIH